MTRACFVAVAFVTAGADPAQAQLLSGQAGEFPLWRVAAVTLLGVVLAIVAVLALAAATRGGGAAVTFPFVRWRGRPGPIRRLRILDQAAASPTLTFCLVACDDHEYLVAATPQTLTVLDRATARPPAESSDS